MPQQDPLPSQGRVREGLVVTVENKKSRHDHLIGDMSAYSVTCPLCLGTAYLLPSLPVSSVETIITKSQ